MSLPTLCHYSKHVDHCKLIFKLANNIVHTNGVELGLTFFLRGRVFVIDVLVLLVINKSTS